MTYKICPKCELNYIMNSIDDLCSECKVDTNDKMRNSQTDDNKYKVEHDLLPILSKLSESAILSLTQKKESFDLLGLRLPLLVACAGLGGESCKKEIIVDASKVYRYYIKPYDINGKMYHVCSQWWSADSNNSKDILNLLKEIKI